MGEATFNPVVRPRGPLGRALDYSCRALAVLAGLVLTAMAVMSVASIVGRAAFDTPIKGDFELVQMMCAMAVAMCLPFCQMVRGHVIVDFFTTTLSAKSNKRLDGIASLLLAVVAFVVSWRMAAGLLDLAGSGDATMLLGLPTWWGYLPMVPSFFLLGCAALFTAWLDFGGDAK